MGRPVVVAGVGMIPFSTPRNSGPCDVMAEAAAQAVEVRTELTPLMILPISRTTLAPFAGASGDHNPMHIDIDVAKSAGLDDVFAHGMLSMAYLGRLLTDCIPESDYVSAQTRVCGGGFSF